MTVPYTFFGLLMPYHKLGIGILYAALTIYSIYLLFKNEKPMHYFIWMLFIIFIPFVGSALYLFKYFIGRKSKQHVS
ncbi:PLDc N-terminal domain-containing protein [Psychroflexus sp. CAK57W]|uniref:PLDc N-terminal domain-containing protein n=1 Tax=Psychroflexus curvus TaxID=2873595 RepID=UPI001CD0374E|nr:PLDc N-terminal domain-containing protein [Psychroflexus curvus]MBZ9786696.1 PLDc N-terminal domain-containing protein [Psychroflexus curvus]